MNISTFIKDSRFHILVVGVVAVCVFTVIWGQNARAAATDTIAATVTATDLAVSVSDGSITFGSVALNTATSTATMMTKHKPPQMTVLMRH